MRDRGQPRIHRCLVAEMKLSSFAAVHHQGAMVFFHVGSVGLLLPTLLHPGGMGLDDAKVDRREPPQCGRRRTLAWEISLEMARVAHAPAAPSRLNCVFATPDIDAARAFRDEFRSGYSIYEAAAAAGTPIHLADFALLRTRDAIGTPYLDFYVDRARRYWVEKPTEMAEVLCGGPLCLSGLCE